jgi:hypothetical protein
MRTTLLILLPLVFMLGACRNAPAEARETMRYDVQAATPETVNPVRDSLRRVLAGDADTPRDSDPHLRAAAAQGLGDLGDPEDAEFLLEVLMGALADDNVQVRMEAAIALGKLRYNEGQDPRRDAVISALRARMAFDRDDMDRLREGHYFVRNAMLNSLIAIGGRAAANAIHDIATRVYRDQRSGASRTAATDKGILDRCFRGLAHLTRTSRSEAAAHRNANDDVQIHLDWWTERIMHMDRDAS